MKRHMIPFSTTRDGDRELIELAFSKKKADDRKEWLRQFRVCCTYWEFDTSTQAAFHRLLAWDVP